MVILAAINITNA